MAQPQEQQRSFRQDGQHVTGGPADQAPQDAVAPGAGAQGPAGAAAVQRMANDPVAPGHELWVHRPLGYHHSGVYVGGGEVVQVHGEPTTLALDLITQGHAPASIDKVPLDRFQKGDALSPGPTAPAFPPEVVIERALGHVGQAWDYNLVDHNCQHFSSEVVSGQADSPEADRFLAAEKRLEGGGQALVGGAEKIAGEVGGAIGGALHHLPHL